MRLYVNRNEVSLLKSALRTEVRELESIQTQTGSYNNQICIDRLLDLLERVELCEALQKNTAQAKRGERQ